MVVDNSKRMAIPVFMHSSSFTKRTCLIRICNIYIDEGYLRKNVAKTCLALPVGWMDKLQGLEGVDKSELVEESQKEEYALYVYDQWKKASTLTHRLYSRGEQDTNKFLVKKKGIKEDKTCLISSREGEEYHQDKWSYLRTG